jgi:hypothetical protein
MAQVVDATEGRIRVRVLVSARDAPTLWDLRCGVREGLVTWLNEPEPTDAGAEVPGQRITG